MLEAKPYLKEIQIQRPPDNFVISHPFNIPAIQKLERLTFHADVTFLVGENGSGKTTLLEGIAIAMGFSPEGGTKNVQLNTAKKASSLSEFIKTIKSYKQPADHYFLRAESFYNVATYMDQSKYLQAYGGKSLHEQSHGEAFISVILNKLTGSGLYIFDEPEAALSPSRLFTAMAAIDQLVKAESQFIIATHSPILMAYPRSKIYLLTEEGIFETTYEETEHYKVTKQFLNNYREILDQILD